jgi:hypothetical protein
MVLMISLRLRIELRRLSGDFSWLLHPTVPPFGRGAHRAGHDHIRA